MVITPDPYDPFYSEAWFTALLEIPGHALSGVVPGTITANGVPASDAPPVLGDRDRDGEPDMLVTFDAFELAATLAPSGPSPVVVRGSVGGVTFDATAIVTVIGHSIDADGDGITDDVDQCLDTPAGAATDGAGCAIVQLCPCSAQFDGSPWTTHGQFVECTVAEARRFAEAGLIGRSDRGGIVSAAARAQCPGDG